MEELETTNPVDGAVAPEAEVETDVQPELDADGNPIEEQASPEEEFEEIERDGKKAKIPAWLKSELLMQADYTRKTQELAEQRKAFDAERTTHQQASAQERQAEAQIAAIDHQLAQFQRTDWNAWNDNDPFAAQKAFQQFQLLKDAKTQVSGYLGQLQQHAEQERQAAVATRLQEGAAQLAKAIPEWSPTHAAKLIEAGQKHFGLSRSDLDGIDDPRIVIALDAAVRWIEHQSKAKKVQAIQAQQEVKPAATAGRSASPVKGLDDRLTPDEWLRRRNAQLKQKG
jgi:hypothetical protein